MFPPPSLFLSRFLPLSLFFFLFSLFCIPLSPFLLLFSIPLVCLFLSIVYIHHVRTPPFFRRAIQTCSAHFRSLVLPVHRMIGIAFLFFVRSRILDILRLSSLLLPLLLPSLFPLFLFPTPILGLLFPFLRLLHTLLLCFPESFLLLYLSFFVLCLFCIVLFLFSILVHLCSPFSPIPSIRSHIVPFHPVSLFLLVVVYFLFVCMFYNFPLSLCGSVLFFVSFLVYSRCVLVFFLFLLLVFYLPVFLVFPTIYSLFPSLFLSLVASSAACLLLAVSCLSWLCFASSGPSVLLCTFCNPPYFLCALVFVLGGMLPILLLGYGWYVFPL